MMKSPTWWSAAAVLALVASACAQQTTEGTPPTEESPGPDVVVSADRYDAALFEDSADVTHRWYPLKPGTRLDYRGSSIDEGERLHHGVTIIVTGLTKIVDGYENVVVWERDYTDGELVETELALFAQDRDGNIWHTGEYPEEWEEGEFVKAPAWVHGIAGATAGVTIPGQPTEGTPDYAQGFAPPPISWADRGKVIKTGERTCAPHDCYADVVVVAEFERSVPGAFQDKSYAPGVGVVRVGWRGKNDDTKEVLELVDFQTLSPAELEKVHDQALALEERAYRISPDVWGATPRSQVRTG